VTKFERGPSIWGLKVGWGGFPALILPAEGRLVINFGLVG